MFLYFKHKLIKKIEKIPLLQIFIYNNLYFFSFLLPHDKDYYALKLLYNKNEKRSFIDVGANIGLSALGFISLGFNNNKIHLFEPDRTLVKKYLNKIKKKILKLLFIPLDYLTENHQRGFLKPIIKIFFFILIIVLVKIISKKNYLIIMEKNLKNLKSNHNYLI